jgi:UBX domain-containing protein 1/4
MLHHLTFHLCFNSFLPIPHQINIHPYSIGCCTLYHDHHRYFRCGPCRASKPQLEDLARRTKSDPKHSHILFAIAYEDVMGDALHSTYNIRAFPTYVRFHKGNEEERVQGVNFAGIQAMIEHCPADSSSNWGTGSGYKLSSGTSTPSNADPVVQARLARLAKLGGGGATAPPAAASAASGDADSKPSAQPEAAATAVADKVSESGGKNEPMEVEPTATEAAPSTAETKEGGDEAMQVDPPADASADASAPAASTPHPFDSLDKEALSTLTESMGFSLLRAQKGLYFGQSVEGAVEWLMQHQDDADIDDELPHPAGGTDSASADASGAGGAVAQSYKCNECGKILSNMANLELHANQTGHSDFEESTVRVKPMTEEEKQAKIAEIKNLLQAKRAEREEEEKVDQITREKQRRMMGKEMVKTREQLEAEQRKREAQQRKREKEDFRRERERIRAELAKDKAERAAHAGKLSSRLGVDGYNPDGIQYDVDATAGGASHAEHAEEDAEQKKKRLRASAVKIDEYISKISSYKAGGDGGNCLRILKSYVGNVVDKPDEEKFQSINTENKVYREKVKQLIGARSLLMAVGFQPNEDNTTLKLIPDADRQLLADTRAKLEKAYEAYNSK